ncbi:MAG: discoidin domain-containing protein, partial [Saprospiraceae bacterium]|nr:discoidin domain-containing protein [Saprospiraceae bacterium]
MNITFRYIVSISLLASFIAPNKIDAQCSDLNESLWENTWESCELTQSPNAQRGEGHWIMYDLGSPYTISTSRIWNSNLELEKGVKSLIVDYSLDGSTWIPLDTLEIAQAKGSDEYAGVIGPDFNNNEVRYILFHIE